MLPGAEMTEQQIDELLRIAELTPVKKDSVLFIGRAAGRLIDNAKYAFLEACRHDYGFSPLFLTSYRDEYRSLEQAGLPAIMFPQAMRQVAAANIVVSDDFWWKTSQVYPLVHNRKTLQLWHGIPLKAIGFAEIASEVNMQEENKADYLSFVYSNYNTVLSTSPYVSQDIFSRVFKCEQFLEAGYPRNDVLLRKPDRLDMLNCDPELFGRLRAHKRAGGKVAFYMPTFRDTGGDIFNDGAIDPKRLDDLCKKHNLLLVLKFHPFIQLEINSKLSNFIVMPSHLDVYPLLGQADFLITDYSSVYFDFLLLNRPIHFYVYDQEKYVSKDREFMLDFEQMTPGKKSRTQEDFFDSLEELLLSGSSGLAGLAGASANTLPNTLCDGWELEREALARKLFSYQDANSAKRVCEFLGSKVKE